MKEILEFGLFISVVFSPIIILWLLNEIANIIARKLTKKNSNNI